MFGYSADIRWSGCIVVILCDETVCLVLVLALVGVAASLPRV